MSEITRTPRVIEDLYEVSIYIVNDSPDAAFRFLGAAEAAFERLLEMPHLGTPYTPDQPGLEGVRRWPVPGFPNHRIFYQPTEDGITVLRVLHGARDVERMALEE